MHISNKHSLHAYINVAGIDKLFLMIWMIFEWIKCYAIVIIYTIDLIRDAKDIFFNFTYTQ